ncbi:MAG TPA: ATP-binding protein [Vicinamibacterales bacterium]|nr:ATP-binding protein [Vicinamibacterales bacterium]
MRVTLHDLPIRRKLLILTLASTASALVFASGGFLIWDIVQLASVISQTTRTQAKLIADSGAAAVEFGIDQTADETLQALKRLEHLRTGCLYRVSDKGLLAKYEHGRACPAQLPDTTDTGFSWSGFDVVETVVASGVSQVPREGKVVGWLYLERDIDDIYARLRVEGLTVLGLLLLAIVIAFLVSSRLQRAVADPLLELAETTRRISMSRDYSLRAIPHSRDEVGVVVHAVNDMLDRIGERTTELSKANRELEHEVEERRRVEEERLAALERERDANRLKDEFLATLSHELRTPLNAVLGWTRVLRTARVEPPTQARALESIERNARVQARLIEDLLEVSRIVTGKLRLRMSETDLATIIDEAVEVVQPAAAAKRLRLHRHIEVQPAMTAGDPDRLQQVVWNLLSNAVKFTPPDGQVTVTLERADGYRLTVRDTGPGIDPKFIPFVFEPFRQADGSVGREHGGLGLGLAIAKRLVELHGGTIHARAPTEGTGAVFEVRLPSVIEAARAERRRPSTRDNRDPVASGTFLRDVHVLVVDDEEDARALLETALTGFGAEVTTAASVDEAMREIDRHAPDVLLSDIGMPIEDGYALIEQLRARPAARGGHIPAIAVTAYASTRDRRMAELAGYQDHIAKPFEPADVARAVARVRRR